MRTIHFCCTAALAALLASSALPVSAADATDLPAVTDVPEYRADAARTGAYPGPGPVAEPVVVWARQGISTTTNPIVADGMLIAGDADGILYALDVFTGEERWRFDSGSPITSVAADDSSVVATDEAGTLHRLELGTGAETWSAAVPGAVSIAIADGLAYVAGEQVQGFDLSDGSPVWAWEGPAASGFLTVTNDTVYASADDGRLYALDREDASERWHVQTISPTVGPAMIAPDTVYLMTLSNSTPVPAGELYALDPDTGAVRWRFRSESGDQVSAGAVGAGVEFSGSIRDGLFAFAEQPGPDGSPEILWHTDIDGSVYRNASLAGDIVYFPQVNPGAVLAVDAETGELLWSVPIADNPIGLVVTGGMILSGGESGTLFALAEPDLAAAVGTVATGPLSPVTESQPVPNPFTIANMIGPEITGLDMIVDLAIGPDGSYYALDYPGRVVVIDPATGEAIREWGQKGTGPGEFDFTRPEGLWGIGAIAVDRDGLVYVGDGANHRYQVFEPDGTFVRQVGSYGNEEGQFSRIFSISVDADGNVYAVDHDLGTLSKFDKDGRFVWRVGGPDAEPPLDGILQSVVARPDGRLFQLREDGPLVELDPQNGAVLDSWDPVHPGWVAFDSAGRTYTGDYEPRAVEVFDADRELIGGTYGPATWMFLKVGPNDELVGWRESGDSIMQLVLDLPAA
jgi:outer membrane protein assembly factor BamB